MSSWESGCSRLCCWMAIGGGRGTASAPSSPSSSPQLCIPDEEDFERVPLLSPSLRMRCRERQEHPWVKWWVEAISYPKAVLMVLLPPKSRPVEWRRCRRSPSATPGSLPCSSWCLRGSFCACGPAFWCDHRLCPSWVGVRGSSTISLRCSRDVWVRVSCGGPKFGWSLAAGRHYSIQTRCLKAKRRKRNNPMSFHENRHKKLNALNPTNRNTLENVKRKY